MHQWDCQLAEGLKGLEGLEGLERRRKDGRQGRNKDVSPREVRAAFPKHHSNANLVPKIGMRGPSIPDMEVAIE